MAARKRQRPRGTGSLFKRDGRGPWVARWYGHDGKRQVRSTRTTDKAAAERILSKHVGDAALRRDGVIDANADRHAVEGRRPLADHVEDWRAALLAKGDAEKHAADFAGNVNRVFAGCNAAYCAHVSASSVQSHLADIRKSRSTRTANFYLQAVKGFCRWMVRDGRAASNPVEHPQAGNVGGDIRRQRRALEAAELVRLLATTETGPTFRRLTGPDRVILYRLAVESELRAHELRSLTPRSFDLDADPPTVTVRAAYSKRRRDDTLRLKPNAADTLARWMADRDADAPVFIVPDKTADMLRADLRRARARWIRETPDRPERRDRRGSDFLAVEDGAGRVVDFHALRRTFITSLARGGVHPKTAQSLARHSTITLTMDRYTHTVVGEQSDALKALPDLTPNPPTPERLRATGTDDVSAGSGCSHLRYQLAREDVRGGARQCHEVAPNTPNAIRQESAEFGVQSGKTRDGATTCGTEGGRTRTCDRRLKRPMLYRLSYAPDSIPILLP